MGRDLAVRNVTRPTITPVLPDPAKVLATAGRLAMDGSLWDHTIASAQVVLIGFIVSSIVAVPLGLYMGTYKAVQAALDPLVNFIRYLPVTSFVPLFILWIGIGLNEKIAALRQEIGRLNQLNSRMMESEDKQISLTDPEARSMATSGRGSGMVGYNVQSAVDTRHHLIVAHEVTNVGSDRDQLSDMTERARATMG